MDCNFQLLKHEQLDESTDLQSQLKYLKNNSEMKEMNMKLKETDKMSLARIPVNFLLLKLAGNNFSKRCFRRGWNSREKIVSGHYGKMQIAEIGNFDGGKIVGVFGISLGSIWRAFTTRICWRRWTTRRAQSGSSEIRKYWNLKSCRLSLRKWSRFRLIGESRRQRWANKAVRGIRWS